MPCGRDTDGLPIGLQVIAPRFREELALCVAAAWESIVIDQGATSTWR